MLFNEGYRDRLLVCRDCGNEFVFTAGEQEFYTAKGLTNVPSRCPGCRSARRSQQLSGQRAPREQHEIICAACGRLTTVPFVPRADRPLYCSDCFQSQRSSRPRCDEVRNYSSSNYGGNNYGGVRGSSYSSGNSYGGTRSRDRRDSNDRDYNRRNQW